MGISFPIPAHLSFDLPSQRTSVTLSVLCSCLKACNSSERFLPVSLSIRIFSIPQRYKNLKERANCTSTEQRSWKIKEPLNNVKCQRLRIFLRRHFQWSKYKIMKSRVPKPWSTLKRNLHEFGIKLPFKEAWIVLPVLDLSVLTPKKPAYCM